MQDASPLCFGPYRLDLGDERLWHGDQVVRLTSKAFQVLWQLAARPQQLVTKDDLFASVWPETTVSDAALTSAIRELRRALQDNPRHPVYIETVHRRGFRFLQAAQSEKREPAASMAVGNDLGPYMVGRQAELAQLMDALQRALRGDRQMVFVTGEPGIGKTTVVSALAERLTTEKPVWVGQGQCIEHYGAGEAYMPVLEALGRLCRAPLGKRLIALLRRHAPTWLAQMPSLLDDAELEALQRAVARATQTRMLREMSEAIEAITAESPLILILEDMQWSDYSTVELLSALARRREAARLLVIATYRPVEVLAHPLHRAKQELQLHGQCQELELAFLSEGAVDAYLAERFADGAAAARSLPGLAAFMHRWTSGNPLFMVTLADALVQQGALHRVEGEWALRQPPEEVEIEIPATLRHLIEQQFERLSPEEQNLLEAASVAGAVFSAAVLTEAGDPAAESIEAACEQLARRSQFVRAAGTAVWPDGAVATRYAFIHALYREVAYGRAPAGRRMRLHRQIGERLEAGYGRQASTIAAELGMHFQQAQERPRAAHYLRQAGEIAVQRSAHVEAIHYLTQSLALLAVLPDTADRRQEELAIQLDLGSALLITRGQAAQVVGDTYSRAYALSTRMGATAQRFQSVWGLWAFHIGRAEFRQSLAWAEQLQPIADEQDQTALRIEARYSLGAVLLFLGQFVKAWEQVEAGLACSHRAQSVSWTLPYGAAPVVSCHMFAARALWVLGYPTQAYEHVNQGLELAQALSHPYSTAWALSHAAQFYQCQRDIQMTVQLSDRIIAYSTEHGIHKYVNYGKVIQGWAHAAQQRHDRGAFQIRHVLSAWQDAGNLLNRPYCLAMLAEAYGQDGRLDKGLSTIANALETGEQTEERWYQAELHRLKGDFLLRQSPHNAADAESSYRQAIAIAQRQQAKSWELRAAASLARLWLQQGKRDDAYALLQPVYGWFTEGRDTADLQDANALLNALAQRASLT